MGNSLKVLNPPITQGGPEPASADAVRVAKDVNSKIMRIYGKFLSEDGSAVDYDGIASSSEFQDWKETLRQLHNVAPEQLSRDERMAFFINLYNALTIHGHIELGVPSNPLTRNSFFNNVAYRVGKFAYSLNDIEHGVLRGNKPHPSAASPQFSSSDDRINVVVDDPDPRIHFSLVCGARSCPPIRIFTPDNLEAALQAAAENFCQDNVAIDKTKHSVQLSMIFKWYGTDFGKSQADQLDYVSQFLTYQQRADLAEARSHSKFSVNWASYDWSQNSNH